MAQVYVEHVLIPAQTREMLRLAHSGQVLVPAVNRTRVRFSTNRARTEKVLAPVHEQVSAPRYADQVLAPAHVKQVLVPVRAKQVLAPERAE